MSLHGKPNRVDDSKSTKRAARRGGPDAEHPYSALSWWWMLAPGGLAIAVAAVIFLDTVLAVAVVAAIVVVVGLALFWDDWFADFWS
jgi:hypothetical protein